jgi:LysM repeat protein
MAEPLILVTNKILMPQKLFMVLLGCTPKGRFTEQHDVFFGIGDSLASLVPQMEAFWPGVQLHIDAWREVNVVDGYRIAVSKKKNKPGSTTQALFFLNLGGYKPGEFEEFHYKMLAVAPNKAGAVKAAKSTAFFKHTAMPGNATSHIDDRYGIDVDDIFEIKDVLPALLRAQYQLKIAPKADVALPEDELHLGYVKWSRLKQPVDL